MKTKNINSKIPIEITLGSRSNKKPIKFLSENRILSAINETFYEYVGITKVNGMFYLSKEMTSGFSRILWSFLPIIIFIFGLTMVVLLYYKYLDSPTRMTIASPLSILEIPFPAITICHPQNVMDYKVESFVNKL